MARQGTLQETFYLTEEVKQALETMMTLPEYNRDNKSEAMRKLILREVDPNVISVRLDSAGLAGDVEFVRQKMIEKNGGINVSYQEELQELAREKATEYRDKKNNSARLTTVVEKIDTLIEIDTEVAKSNAEVARTNREVARTNRELAELIRRDYDLSAPGS